jgi:hypothetical protein
VIQARSKKLRSEIHKLMNSVHSREELPSLRKESIVSVPIYKAIKLTSHHCRISLLSSYKMLSNILLSGLSQYINEVTGDHRCGFLHNNQLLIRYFAFNSISNL